MAFRKNFPLMNFLSGNIVTPIRKLQTEIASHFSFSLAEVLIALVIAWLIFRISRRKWKKLLTGVFTLVLFAYAGFCFLWGTYYYGDAGLAAAPVSTEQLAAVTEMFAEKCNDNWRDEPDRNEIIQKSAVMNNGIGCKKIACSKVMSLIDFEGFFFPFTGEANVNIDMPAHDLAATCAHELCHLNGIPREGEANFYGVKNSLEFGDEDYVYSACLSAYTYLGNALHDADYEAWLEISNSLSYNVKADLAETSEYWAHFRTPVKKASNAVYSGFLESYGQPGLQSYGTCVDLLVNYYYGR